MNIDHRKFSSKSLTQHFDAPEDYVGHFGLLCGYSADAAFLNDAAERFTRLTAGNRAHQGRIALAVFLDPGSPAISLLDSPGVAHLPIRDITKKPFRLLHAKVALLGFRHQENSSQWILRLFISTGNWTRQTLEQSLDLAWEVEFSSEALKSPHNDIQQICADFKAANDLMQWIESLFDTRLLNVTVNGALSETKNAKMQFDAWILSCTRKAKGEPRFFDSRSNSLLTQLPSKVKACGRKVARNYLAMASGFYEASADKSRPPEVPKKIIEKIKAMGLLTKKPTIDIYVNAEACQSIAFSVKALNQQGMTVRPAGQPSDVFGDCKLKPRSLHAKFLLSANSRDNSNSCNNAWIYLGSGNLTNPGFVNKMGVSAGNLEAGVVFAPDALLWKDKKGVDKQKVVSNLLPIQWDDAVDSNKNLLSPGLSMEPRDDVYVAPPVAWLEWHKADSTSELRTTESVTLDFLVVDSTGNACERTETGFLWKDSRPRQVSVCWMINETQQEATIPVIDQYGRIAATELQQISVDEALWQLADFPLPPDEEDHPIDGVDENNEKNPKHDLKRNSAQPLSYPIRHMMELVESIAAKQTEINERDWVLWCNRLEQTLGQAKESSAVKAFLKLELNPLSPLWNAPFRPAFAETSDSGNGQLYEETLTRIERGWMVNKLNSIGDAL